MHMIGYRRLAAAAAVFTAFITAPAHAAEPVLRVGKAQPESIAFTPVDVGHRLGIFKKHGIDVAIMAFGGGAKLHQGIVAGSVDIGLGSGPDLPFIVKGAPERAVAVTVNAPTYTVLMVKPESPIKSPADVKGKSVLVGSEKSLTAWLAKRIAVEQGWKATDIKVVPAGTGAERLALLRTGQADSMITDFTLATKLAKQHQARIAFSFGELVPVFHTHMIFASDKLIKEHPDQVKAFLAGWFDTIAFMQTHEKETVPVLMDVLKIDNDVASQAWTKLMSMFSTDGKFDPKAMAMLSKSFVDLGLLPSEPKDMSSLFTEAYLPKK